MRPATSPQTDGPVRIVACDTDPEGAWALCRALRKRDDPTRLLLLLGGGQLGELELRDDLYDDFCLTPFHPVEVEARLRHLLFQGLAQAKAETVEYSGLALNVETYQASIEGRPLDLTYMEYELLKFLAQNPGKVFTARSCCRGCGATSTTAAPARSTCTSAACAPSSARSRPT